MASNLTGQVRNIAEVTTAVAQGDLSRKITVDVRGEILELKNTINTMVDQLNGFAGEVTRVAREVGTEGKLGGQAQVPGVAGTWKDLTDNVNSMASNLTGQVRNIAEVTTAVAKGDLSRKITVDVRGEILELKNTINTMVDQLNAFAGEVTRVAREVGTEGKLGGQAQVPGVAGTWKDLTDNVNFMASNLTAQVRNIAEVATAIAGGDLSKKITVDVRGELLLLKETLNTTTEQLRSFAAEVTRVAREVGTDGRLGGQAVVPGAAGTWKDLTDNVNLLAANLTTQVRNIAEVTTAVARGDLSRKITVDVKGEILELKNTINTMVDQLNGFASEVTRVAREVGTEGKLGGQAEVPGVAGTWKDLTDTVNFMAANLTEQVRGIVKVVTAVADGDLKQNLTVKSKGEVAALADTINNMTGTLATFADQVTTVAREVGVEGRLGGQAAVPGAAGTWKDLTGNVNLLAANLTNQVRAIAEVATAVTKGDLTRSIQVDARGEVAELKDNINTMIDNLRLTTDRNTEQDWLKTNLARVTGMLQGQRDLTTVGRLLLNEMTELVEAQLGVIYQMEGDDAQKLKLLSAHADDVAQGHPETIRIGQGLVGQCALNKRRVLIEELPAHAVPIGSALFKVVPQNVVVLPVVFESQLKAVIELASVKAFTPLQITFLEQLTASIGIVLNSIEATMQTEALLKQSQNLAGELQSQKRELQDTNDQLEQKAQQLAERNVEVERKNQEIEQARGALEEKASELALTSKYKSEFLANMSHELRTPLNSILILGQQLTENPEGNLSAKQVEFARTIHGAGTDLLNLISDILDLSKIESGTVTVDAEEMVVGGLLDSVARPFRHEAETRGLSFEVAIEPGVARTMTTDSKRLQQVLKNLLSNAFKFTAHGGVKMTVSHATSGWNPKHPVLDATDAVIAFEVADSGIGIPLDKQRIIFEAFQQADASTSRKYGGTGLGLAISRELASLLGGEIHLRSTPGRGSNFILYLPAKYVGASNPQVVDPQAARPKISRSIGEGADAASKPVEQVAGRPQRDRGRGSDPADRRGRRALCEDPRRPCPQEGVQGSGRDQGHRCAGTGQAVPAVGRVARRVPARHARLDRAEPAQAEPADPAHPGPGRHPRRGSPACAGARRLLVRQQAVDQRRGRRRDRAHQGLFGAEAPATPDRRGQPVGADEHRRAARARRHRDRDRRQRRACAECHAQQSGRLPRARSEAAGHVRLRGARGDAGGYGAGRCSRRRVHRAGTLRAGGCDAAQDGAQHRRQGRGVAGTSARRDVTVSPSGGYGFATRKTENAGTSELVRRGSGRTHGAAGRRRRAQYLRALQRAGAARHERADRDHGPRGDRPARGDVECRHRADGYHDAGDGRLSDDRGDPAEPGIPPPADRGVDGEGDEGRPGEVSRRRRVGLSRKAGQYRTAAGGAAHVAASLMRTPGEPEGNGRKNWHD